MPFMGPRQNCRNNVAKHDREKNRQGDACNSQVKFTEHVVVLMCIKEKKLNDKWSE